MKVKIKKLAENAVIPKYSKPGDAGLDLVATSYKQEGGNFVYGTGLSVEIPKGHVGLIFPRSSICNTALVMSNSVGVIDSGYRGEIMLKFFTPLEYYMDEGIPKAFCEYEDLEEGSPLDIYNVGDRIGQLIIMPYPQIQFEESEELSDTERGKGGYGSTGK
jgi:dUTP pyrophosphatase